MCNSNNCQHDDLNDDISDIFGADLGAGFDIEAAAKMAREQLSERFETKCRKCRGSGRFVGYTGRVLGSCFACKGKGVIYTKTDPAVLAANRAKAAEKKAKQEEQNAEQARAWLEANPVEAEWMRRPVTGDFTFHRDMWEALYKYGSLTERQEAAVRNAAAKFNEARARKQAEKEAREAGAAVLSMAKIRAGFDSARQHLKRPKLRIADVQFSLAPATGRNAGCIYVVEASSDTYLGKITPEDKFLPTLNCSDELAATVARVAADPAAAAEAHGHEYGQCSCCGRELTNPESVARGIGPICAERWGF